MTGPSLGGEAGARTAGVPPGEVGCPGAGPCAGTGAGTGAECKGASLGRGEAAPGPARPGMPHPPGGGFALLVGGLFWAGRGGVEGRGGCPRAMAVSASHWCVPYGRW